MPRRRRAPDEPIEDRSPRARLCDRFTERAWEMLFADAMNGVTSQWQHQFMRDMASRFDEYGYTMYLSDKQAAMLERIADGNPLAWWSVLGLKRTATADEIKRKHRELAIEHHPDRGGSPRRMTRINVAREIGLKRAAAG